MTIRFLDSVEGHQELTENEKKLAIYSKEKYDEILDEHSLKILSAFFSLSYSHSPDSDYFYINQDGFSLDNEAAVYQFGENFGKEDVPDNIKVKNRKQEIKILSALGVDISEENYNEKIKEQDTLKKVQTVMNLKAFALNLKQEFLEYEKEEFALEEEYFKECENIESKIHLEILKDYYKEIMPYVDNNTKENIMKALEMEVKDKAEFISIADKSGIYSSYSSIGQPGLIEAFSQESYYCIQSENDDYTKKSIQRRQEKYINSRNDLEIPSTDIVSKIEEIRKNYEDKYKIELYEKTSSYENNLDYLDTLNLKLMQRFDLDWAMNNLVGLTNNISKTQDGEKLSGCINIPLYSNYMRFPCGYVDSTLIHEICHVVELSYKENDNEQYPFDYIFKTGFEYIGENIKKGNEIIPDSELMSKRQKRSFELFSENIHQRNAINITESLHKKGVYLLDDELDSHERRLFIL